MAQQRSLREQMIGAEMRRAVALRQRASPAAAAAAAADDGDEGGGGGLGAGTCGTSGSEDADGFRRLSMEQTSRKHLTESLRTSFKVN